MGAQDFLISWATGVVAFTSPCFLPILLGYAALVAALGFQDRRESRGCLAALFPGPAIFFSLGFFPAFIIFSLPAWEPGFWILEHQLVIRGTAGALALVFGLHLALARDPGEALGKPANRLWSRPTPLVLSFMLGLGAAGGFDPCPSPALTSSVLLGSVEGHLRQGALLLTAYAVGLAIPLFMTGVAFSMLVDLFPKISQWTRTGRLASGIFLAAWGVLLAPGWLDRLTALVTRFFPE